jgi:hypothetical protein
MTKKDLAKNMEVFHRTGARGETQWRQLLNVLGPSQARPKLLTPSAHQHRLAKANREPFLCCKHVASFACVCEQGSIL